MSRFFSPYFHSLSVILLPSGLDCFLIASQLVLLVKNLPVNVGGIRDVGSVPGSGRSPGVGKGNPLQYSYLKNPMDRGDRQATVHGVAKSRTQLK